MCAMTVGGQPVLVGPPRCLQEKCLALLHSSRSSAHRMAMLALIALVRRSGAHTTLMSSDNGLCVVATSSLPSLVREPPVEPARHHPDDVWCVLVPQSESLHVDPNQ